VEKTSLSGRLASFFGRVCRFAIAQLNLYDVGHEQIWTVWVDLRDVANRQALRLEALAEIREFLQVHWKPCGQGPSFSCRSPLS
jgi:hypothetical protein